MPYRFNFCTTAPYYIPYNPLVAAAFFRAGYIEAWGRGIEKINHECDLADVPKPDYNYEFAGLMITFKMDIEEKTPGKSSPKSSPKTENIGSKLNCELMLCYRSR